MHITDIIGESKPTISFEFFPPKTEQSSQALFQCIKELEELKPSFVSITYGAGGSTRELTHELVLRIKDSTSLTPVPHLTCVNHTEEEIFSILEKYAKYEISNVLALRGDPPTGDAPHDRSLDAFQYASHLVGYIQKFKESGQCKDPRGFGIGVAGFPEGHPETPNRILEMDHLKQKIDSGADYICTQLFFDNHDFYDFQERCQLSGINVPIIAGIMPVTSAKGLLRMAELAAGARIPGKLLKAIDRCNGDTESIKRVGIQYATEQCSDLLNNSIDGIHFYTLNRSDATKGIFQSLGLHR
ncbi:methylenetetrahydrofolate reductase [NAD(P)H] [Verrucomicrobiales bacterium]|mgnify:FL=1|nr:methylenetetrahydrofolate reductase [NAD(P)H] [Verrucomicrobiales bacterium]NCG27962.1 methylenetetrahydrofolate reductase [NAD(P)H] [Verrucomicrobiales bacterium]